MHLHASTGRCRCHPRSRCPALLHLHLRPRLQVVQAAICPERRLGDDSLSAVASVTHTHVTNDMSYAKIYVSVYSDDLGKRRAMDNLQRLEP